VINAQAFLLGSGADSVLPGSNTELVTVAHQEVSVRVDRACMAELTGRIKVGLSYHDQYSPATTWTDFTR
jgi:hypothetical protein